MARLTVGATAPEFNLPDSSGSNVALSAYRGRELVVYFYPKAATPGCTTEACDFRDNLSSLRSAGFEVLGISPDPVAALSGFVNDNGLTFPLLSDERAVVARAWGAWGEKVINGTPGYGVHRSTFVLDGQGVVRLAEYDIDPVGHVLRLRAALGILPGAGAA